MADHEARKARYQQNLIQARQRINEQADTIHQLRSEKDHLHTLHTKIDRGDLRRLERDNDILRRGLEARDDKIHELRRKIRELNDRLSESVSAAANGWTDQNPNHEVDAAPASDDDADLVVRAGKATISSDSS
jgi:hypothetical protein